MPDASGCSSCGAELGAGAASCAACGKLVATPAKNAAPVVAGCLGGFALGVVLAAAALTAEFAAATYSGSHAELRMLTVAGVLLVAVAIPIGMFASGFALAVRGKPGLGTFLMTGAAIGLLVPSPCTFAVVTEAFMAPSARSYNERTLPQNGAQPYSRVMPPVPRPGETFGPARTPRPVSIPAQP